MGSAGLRQFANQILSTTQATQRLGSDLAERLIEFISDKGKLLDSWTGVPCLTHGDFGPSNILVNKQNGKWSVSAVLDWEFAFSGTPFFDFGNLFRDPLGSHSQFANSVTEAYCQAGGVLPKHWKGMSQLADLTAWLEFLSRKDVSSQIVEDAKLVIGRTIDNWPAQLN